MVSIARKNLFEDLPRFMVAQAGIMFAVSLVTIQTGLLEGFGRSSTLLIDRSKADIWVASKEIRYLDLTLPIDYERLNEAAAVEGVELAEALVLRGAIWQQSTDGEIDPVRVVGFDSGGELFQPWAVQSGQVSELDESYGVMIDRVDQRNLNITGIGDTAGLNDYPAIVKGFTQGIRSIVTSPYVFTSLENANLYLNFPRFDDADPPEFAPSLNPETPIQFILIRVDADYDLETVRQDLQLTLPDQRIMTTAELSQLTRAYWRSSTGVGFILGLGAIVGIIVGTVIVGQILYSSVSDRLQEYGTLKAMGASDWYLYRIIIEQALWMAIMGYIPGLILSLTVGAWTMETRAIRILITPETAATVFTVTVTMCTGAALFAIQKVTHLDPAIVFKS
ncbi:ABC transporter permease [Candidatus Synechococcus calcipolaris G9]|uniref:ABC transporter permease n=1 Tax=Candidatus Synechococcus calcipolaris G9 TaxID=1497997 RepID=A0ABT6F0R7_9SYNE|nr:ABC transporter permease [Candidatus Synechococcus calcipolaris]MDG2991417.1 ABC transporter permease [Candidatus Synechococcus calcipolaris G9]